MSHDAPPIESMIAEVKKRGLLINNLYQTNAGWWICNVRSREGHDFYEFGSGPDAAGAIEGALAKVDAGKRSPAVPTPDYDRLPGAKPVTVGLVEDEDLIG